MGLRLETEAVVVMKLDYAGIIVKYRPEEGFRPADLFSCFFNICVKEGGNVLRFFFPVLLFLMNGILDIRLKNFRISESVSVA